MKLTMFLSMALLSAQAFSVAYTPIKSIVKDGNRMVGKTVTIKGEVEKVLGKRSIIVESDGTWFDNEIFVVSRKSLEPMTKLREEQNIEVTGVVRSYDKVSVEKDFTLSQDTEKYDVELEKNRKFLEVTSLKILKNDD